MIHNDCTPAMQIDAQSYEVRADGELLTCEAATVLPMAQRHFCSEKATQPPAHRGGLVCTHRLHLSPIFRDALTRHRTADTGFAWRQTDGLGNQRAVFGFGIAPAKIRSKRLRERSPDCR